MADIGHLDIVTWKLLKKMLSDFDFSIEGVNDTEFEKKSWKRRRKNFKEMFASNSINSKLSKKPTDLSICLMSEFIQFARHLCHGSLYESCRWRRKIKNGITSMEGLPNCMQWKVNSTCLWLTTLDGAEGLKRKCLMITVSVHIAHVVHQVYIPSNGRLVSALVVHRMHSYKWLFKK